MRAADLDIHELLHFVPEGGIITFAGERVLLLDAVALGLLRKELIETLGLTAARAVLTRFGYAHGWRVAETLRKGFPVGQRRRVARRRRAPSYDSGPRARGGDTRLAQQRRAQAPKASGTIRTRPSSICCISARRTSRSAGR